MKITPARLAMLLGPWATTGGPLYAALADALRAAAGRVGAGRAFPGGIASGVQDDHLPYLERGVRAIDLIDFDYPPWHTVDDDLDQVSPRSLDAVGETLVELLRVMRRETCPGA